MTDTLLYSLPAWLLFLLLVGVPVGIAWVATLLVHGRTPAAKDEKHNEVAGFIFATVGVVYAVLLAFVVIIVWEQFLAAEDAVSQEASAVITVAHDTSSFPEPARRQARDQLRAYARFVLHDEWKTLDEASLEQEERTTTLAALNTLWGIYRSLPPTAVDAHTTESLDSLSAQRAIRLHANQTAMPDVLWLALVIGAVVTVCFSLILHMKNVHFHAAMTALLTALLTTCLWLIVLINHPFSGEVSVPTDAFQQALYVINNLPG
jgi:predicted ABC-type exoprotein transport system permease subunit